ncbi:insulin-like growth factor-binding protein-related protein 1 isoform X1 [Lycorma delicatula]|uniref:insulin-like growth factor-binding protein-related protein 1 isoform X1 n=1 Tax=Lycorma delicatula TaxID=130591 RepID=UPI003F517252
MERLLLLTIFAISLVYVTACPPCEKLHCPKSAAECLLGVVPDPCECCPIGRCGLARGELCYNQSLSDPAYKKFGYCAEAHYCSVEPSEDSPGYLDGICVCAENQVACGSDNRTYENICALSEAATETGVSRSLVIQHWGPCEMAPEIVSKPENVAAVLGQPVTLDCEVKGYPTPVVIWEFTGNDGLVKILPSDDPLVSVQVRGGPESQMSTTWVQLVELRPIDAGIYSCVATNEKGTSRAMAHVEIAGIS